MDFKIGDIVSRNSYNNDVVFEIVAIQNGIALLKGSFVRLYADAPLDDLVLCDNRDEYEPNLKVEELKKRSRIGKKYPNNFEVVEIEVDCYNSWSEGFEILNKNI